MVIPRSIRSWHVLLATSLIVGCSTELEVVESAELRPAKIIEIESSTDIRSLTLPAVIEAATSTELTFQVGGLLSELAVRGGQRVNQGDVIARLDTREFANDLAQAQAQSDQAQSEFARAERLITEDAISRSVFEQREAQLDVAEAALDSALKRLEDSVLRAPFDGLIAQVPAEAFQNVSSQDPIVIIQSIGSAEAVAQIPVTLVAHSDLIEPIETNIVMDAAPESPMQATLLSTDTLADPTTQTFEARFVFNPPDELTIFPGMTGSIEAVLRIAPRDGSAEQITVPLEAIVSSGDKQFVWVVDPESMSVSKRAVEVGPGVGEQLPIVSGLAVGELIVGAGVSNLHEGMHSRR